MGKTCGTEFYSYLCNMSHPIRHNAYPDAITELPTILVKIGPYFTPSLIGSFGGLKTNISEVHRCPQIFSEELNGPKRSREFLGGSNMSQEVLRSPEWFLKVPRVPQRSLKVLRSCMVPGSPERSWEVPRDPKRFWVVFIGPLRSLDVLKVLRGPKSP